MGIGMRCNGRIAMSFTHVGEARNRSGNCRVGCGEFRVPIRESDPITASTAGAARRASPHGGKVLPTDTAARQIAEDSPGWASVPRRRGSVLFGCRITMALLQRFAVNMREMEFLQFLSKAGPCYSSFASQFNNSDPVIGRGVAGVTGHCNSSAGVSRIGRVCTPQKRARRRGPPSVAPYGAS